jgi:hypothetical protein
MASTPRTARSSGDMAGEVIVETPNAHAQGPAGTVIRTKQHAHQFAARAADGTRTAPGPVTRRAGTCRPDGRMWFSMGRGLLLSGGGGLGSSQKGAAVLPMG